MNSPLPDKLSDLILVALDDLEKVENDERYTVNMDWWHRSGDTCLVCLAGSVMAKSLDVSPDRTRFPNDFDEKTEAKLDALNWAHVGDVDYALHHLDVPQSSYTSFNRSVVDYSDDPEQFKADMREIAAVLKEQDL